MIEPIIAAIGASVIAQNLLASSLLMLVVLAVRAPVARRFGAQTAYALWLLPALRLVLPPLPAGLSLLPAGLSPLGRMAAAQASQTPAGGAGMALVPADAASALAAPAAALPWAALLFGLWLAGALLWAAWQVWRYHLFLTAALADAELLARYGNVDVLVSAAVAGPLATGIRRRRIFLPIDFGDRYAAGERRLALLHEGAHHDRGDILANLAGLAVLAVHWWNPVAHAAWRAFRADQELACDATVLAGADGEMRHSYGSAILKSACARTPTAACAMTSKTQLKERLKMMKHHDIAPARRRLGIAFGAMVVAGGLALSAAAAPPADPAAPAAPAVPVPATPPAPAAAPSPAVPPDAPSAPVRKFRTIIIKDGQRTETTSDVPPAFVIPGGTADDKAPGKGTPARVIITEIDDDEDLPAAQADGSAPKREALRKLIITCKSRAPVDGNAASDPLADCRPPMFAAIDPSLQETLLSARKSVETSAGLTDAQRRSALAGLDKAIAETKTLPPAK
jgi:beta-lactamase regulating signal transducer with metallopeptidase domain